MPLKNIVQKLLPLLLLTLLLGAASSARAGTVFCSEFTNAGTSTDPRYVVDGFDPLDFAKISSASTFGIDGNCTVKNFPESSGGFPIVNINYQFFGNATYYIDFDNVYYYGNMSCNDPTQATFWIYWAPGGYNNISPKCQDFMVPVDAVVKQNPAAQTTASIGIPFVYTIKVPVLGQLDADGIFGYLGDSDDYPINNVVIADDLTTTGVALSYVSNTAYRVNPDGTRTALNGGSPLIPGAGSAWLSNHPGVLDDPANGGLVFSYERNPDLALVEAGENVEIDLTLVLDDTNTPLSTFTNTAEMWFDKTINTIDVIDLHAWPGTTLPMTVAEPDLVVEKTSPVSNLNVGSAAPFTIDVENIGGGTAFNATITDKIPDVRNEPGLPRGGMCGYDPTTAPGGVTARIVASDSSVVANLNQGSDYSVAFDPSACELKVALLDTPAARIEPNQHLVINYESQLDGGTDPGLTFTNVAGATSWFNGDSSIATRLEYVKTLTDGTPDPTTPPDFQDALTITSATQGYFFLKSVDDLTTGTSSATGAFPGDRLRYTLQIQNFNIPPLNDITIIDGLGSGFVPGSLSINSAGTNLPVTPTVDPTGGPNGTGSITITGLDLDSDTQYQLQFDVTLASALPDGTVVSNQASLTGTDASDTAWSGVSDDPNVGGPSLLGNTGDPTTVTIQAPAALSKANPAITTATIGDQFTYRITVPAAPVDVPLYDVRILDDLDLAAADMSFVSASAHLASGTQSWTLTNVGSSATDLTLQDTVTGIDIPAGDQAVVEITVRLLNTDTNQSGISFTNSATYTYNRLNGGGISTQLDGAEGTTPTAMSVLEPALSATKAVSFVSPAGKPPTDPAASGDVLEYTVTISNSGDSTAFDTDVVDTLPANLSLVPGSATARINGADVAGFVADPTTLPGGELAWGRQNGDETFDIPAGQSLVLTYRVTVGLVTGTDITNSVYVDWTSLDGASAGERTGAGCPANDPNDPDDYCYGPAVSSVTSELEISFEKSVVNVTTGEDPGANAEPGDTLRYTILLANESIAPLSNISVVDELAAQFASGTLQNLSVSDPNADTTNTSGAGGANGTGLVDIRNLTLAAQGDPGDTLTIEFTATLAPVIQSGTAVLNRALLTLDNLASATSNETSTLITSAPALEVWKTSEDITGDPAELRAGDTLRYTITVKNVGNENAEGAVLRDQIPTNTTYAEGSTTLNGNPVADPAAGTSALQSGLAINAPADLTAGVVPGDPAGLPENVATVTFDVVINANVVDGALIANQGFLGAEGAGSGPAPEEPSDDPDTPTIPDDPTLDVVGTVPLVDAHKTVEIVQPEIGSAGIVDPSDMLRYTIAVTNLGSAPATGVTFIDAVPVGTTYVPDSARLNGLAVGPAGSTISPLASGIDVSSSDLPPPGAGLGVLSPGETATITFEVQVDAGAVSGDVISNQGVVSTSELPDEPTDADGIDTNGDQPTQVVVGDAQQLSILKEVFVIDGSEAAAGGQLEYVIRVTNIGSLPATNVVATDDLGPLAGQVSYVPGSGRLNGSSAGISYAGSVLTVDYAAQYGGLPAGAEAVLRFRVQIDPAAAIGTTLTNTGLVSWNDPARTENTSVSLDVGGTPGSGTLNGWIWHDASFDKVFDGTEAALEGWTVELYRGNQLLASVPTDAGGAYSLSGLTPNVGAEPYDLRFRAAGAGPNTPSLGIADSPFTDGPQQVSGISVGSGATLSGLNLPITPNGTVYDSVLRTPVAGAGLAMLNAATGDPLPSGCFDDPAQQNQVTLASGFYKFDLKFGNPSCQPGDTYVIDVTPPATGYLATPSQIIPPNGDPVDPFNVPACPGSTDDAVPATAEYCEATTFSSVPPFSVQPRTDGTVYHLYLTLTNDLVPGHSQLFNNNIAIDSELAGAVAITKTSSRVNVSKGELVPYTITVRNVFGVPLFDIGIVDSFPAGFKYVEGSARLDGEAREPVVSGRQLLWDGLDLQFNGEHTLQLLLVVGAGVSEGEFVNRAQVLNIATGGSISGEASATVRVVPDPTFDCTDVIGKVFDDRDLNGYQDDGEEGLAGVRVVTARGLIGATDVHGRFHIACAAVPDEDRGSNFILKLDDRSLPTGYRVTTENPRVQRATRGKALKFNFGATVHRVVGLDIADGVFAPETTELRPQWQPRIDLLLEELEKGPAVLRLSYLADVEGDGLVRKRLKALKKEIADRWALSKAGYRLDIETEVFWRRGGPPER